MRRNLDCTARTIFLDVDWHQWVHLWQKGVMDSTASQKVLAVFARHLENVCAKIEHVEKYTEPLNRQFGGAVGYPYLRRRMTRRA